MNSKETQAHVEESRIKIKVVEGGRGTGSRHLSSVSGKDISCFLPQVRTAIGWASVAQRALWGLSSGTFRAVTLRLDQLYRIETLLYILYIRLFYKMRTCSRTNNGEIHCGIRQQARLWQRVRMKRMSSRPNPCKVR